MLKLPFVCVAMSFSALAAPSSAHEFWIEPLGYMLSPGDTLEATIKVGTEFEGSSYAYLPTNFRRFDLTTGGETAPVPGRIGDRPAVQVPVEEPGLTTLIHVTRDYELTWETWQKFEDFVDHKDGAGVLDTHRAQYEEADGVREVYSRYGKSLVAVGEGAGQDQEYGLTTEIVALENPYTGDLSDGFDIRVLYDGAPRADEQVEIFARNATDEVTITTTRTNADGVATIDVAPDTEYLLDSVVFREPADDLNPDFAPQWETLWASLTFHTPGAAMN
ncbi:Nickel uptake substrate-specific transmembrane region [Rhodobacteraceae bacterium THAF1]|uniref:DUF4198 domain-containing protein n=1 Tax=Palleronia sp. THAF1 TaxID=2587842 RepID=UPI000F4164E8|nr:DUF4198 domain-containing protein [Palleronia sp. THAF1]QFU09418.1 Nickel uptake substrate-specific transmembrane region [Palleronia sp. THAF1]VDC21950.1 Nickel uptake substrate-specific transmembrane region [Rhodobacteraceae bacterium THAF1]